MTRTTPQSDIDRLGKLEARTKGGEVPDVKELNAVRRLLDWRDRERDLAEARGITRG